MSKESDSSQGEIIPKSSQSKPTNPSRFFTGTFIFQPESVVVDHIAQNPDTGEFELVDTIVLPSGLEKVMGGDSIRQ